MIAVAHNLAAMNAQRQFNITEKKKAKTTEKLASGYKINRAADDAAGLSISEKMRNQIRNLHQSMNNIEDGIYFCQTGEGALNECHSILNRLEELAVKAANDVNAPEDRKSIEDETKQLQEELRVTLRRTEFNGRKYFSEPYMPEMVGDADDIHLYNTSTGQYGGIMIDNVRYSWSELGACIAPDPVTGVAPSSIFEADGITYKGTTIEFWCPSSGSLPGTPVNGSEKVVFELPRGQQAPVLNRKYSWEAKSDGIYMNSRVGSPTVKWEDLNPAIDHTSTDDIPAGEYSFLYRDTTIYFEVPKNAKLTDVIDGMNDSNMLTTIDWRSEFDGTEEETGIRVIDYTKMAYITDDNKFYIDGKQDPAIDIYTDSLITDGSALATDQSGIRIKYGSVGRLRPNDSGELDSTVLNATQQWTNTYDMHTGQYPIADFNRGVNGNSYTGPTLDEDAFYAYIDPNKLNFAFAFELSDEVGEEIVKSGIETEIKTAITAPVDMEYNLGSSTYTHISNTYADMSYNLQRDTHKTFNNLNVAFSTNLEAPVRNAAGDYIFQYNVYDSNNGLGATNPTILSSAAYTVSRNTLLDACENGTTIHFAFNSGENSYGESFSAGFDVSFDKFNTTSGYNRVLTYAAAARDSMYNTQYNSALATARSYYNQHPEMIRYADGSVSQVDFDSSVYKSTTEQQRIDYATSAAQAEYERVYNIRYGQELDAYADLCFDSDLGAVSFGIKQTENPYQTYYLKENSQGNVAIQTDFNVVMNPTDRGLYIQSGANAGEDTYLSWDSLNLNVLHLGSANVSSREKASQFIQHVQEASKIISANRSRIGAQQNRLERTYDANANYSENLQYAESNIRDADMAKEAMDLGKHSILEQAGQAMMAQANQQNQGILQLIQS